MLSIEFPQSRISRSSQCELCKGPKGVMQKSKAFLQDEAGTTIELLKWTCDLCGYTMLFDMNVIRNHPLHTEEYTEVLPE